MFDIEKPSGLDMLVSLRKKCEVIIIIKIEKKILEFYYIKQVIFLA